MMCYVTFVLSVEWALMSFTPEFHRKFIHFQQHTTLMLCYSDLQQEITISNFRYLFYRHKLIIIIISKLFEMYRINYPPKQLSSEESCTS